MIAENETKATVSQLDFLCDLDLTADAGWPGGGSLEETVGQAGHLDTGQAVPVMLEDVVLRTFEGHHGADRLGRVQT